MSGDNVVKFYANNAAENPDAVLEQALGEYNSVMVVGYDKEGDLDARASLNLSVAEAHYLISLCQDLLIRHGSPEMEVV